MRRIKLKTWIALCTGLIILVTQQIVSSQTNQKDKTMLEIATFGGGCFWCTEAVYKELKGVTKVESGYAGGTVVNPTYKQICTGTTGHAEVIQITYDPSLISFVELLEVFFYTHDPTTLNRQGNDVGTQYRSVIFYHNEKQKEEAGKYIALLNSEHAYAKPVVTQLSKYTNYSVAEDYHQNYYNLNKTQPYCQAIIKPKLEKFRSHFEQKLK
jgi:peptide-methionine (S)-S-oxide reductase